MKNIMRIVLVSVLGSLITLGAYKAFMEEPEIRYIQADKQATALRANYVPADKVSFVEAAEQTVNSVVHVKTAVRSQYRQPQSPLDFFFGHPQQRGGQGQLRLGSGSGVIISEDGYIITNNHVIERAEEILVTLNDGQEYAAEIVGRDPSTDIALIKVKAADLPFLSFSNSDQLRVGQWVLAVGNPFNLTSTVTAGIVSAKGRNIGIIDERSAIESFIQTDAAVNPGNSGGALVNVAGELVGINSAISTHTGSFEGYSFAVPSNLAKKVVEDLMEYGRVQRAFIGVNIRDLSPRLSQELDIDRLKGVYIAGVTNKGAAEEAGIKAGDVLVAVNERAVNSSAELQELIGGKRPGEEVKVKVIRDGSEKFFTLTLRNAKGTTQALKNEDVPFVSLLGGSFRAINQDESALYGLRHGVKVEEVQAGLLSEQGIPEGFIITHINQMPIKGVEDINAAIARKPANHPVVIYGVKPNGSEKYYAFKY